MFFCSLKSRGNKHLDSSDSNTLSRNISTTVGHQCVVSFCTGWQFETSSAGFSPLQCLPCFMRSHTKTISIQPVYLPVCCRCYFVIPCLSDCLFPFAVCVVNDDPPKWLIMSCPLSTKDLVAKDRGIAEHFNRICYEIDPCLSKAKKPYSNGAAVRSHDPSQARHEA